ncbi:UNVERIFIED_ASMBLY: hypothetical protein SD1_22 [Shigella phage 2019SD1]|uniref:Uncharacterized protein n=1 Tax=Shigella phage 2019SD1 TaxID=2848074 RepID=A0A6M5C8Z7_9CAUD|nr:hypothetical protein H1N84_gp22 [Shigella phage 2019SD1]
MMLFVDGKKVPAGEIDMRFKGLSSDDDRATLAARYQSKPKSGNPTFRKEHRTGN